LDIPGTGNEENAACKMQNAKCSAENFHIIFILFDINRLLLGVRVGIFLPIYCAER
jgi:hypothetical protein